MIPKTVYEGIKSYVVSTAFALQSTVQTAFIIGYGMGLCATPMDAWHFITSPGVLWGIVCGVFGGVGPYYRTNQGVKATAAKEAAPNAQPPTNQ